MLARLLLRQEHAKLGELQRQRANTACIIRAEQAALKQETIRGLGTGEGLLLSFAAGCAARLTIKHGPAAARLRHFPLSQVLGLVSLLAQLKGAH